METMKVKWVGTVPMLMHNERLADPLDPHTKALAALTSTRGNAKKTDAHVEDVARAEWEGGLYHDDDIGPFVPGYNVRACIREGAKLSKLGREIERAVHVVEDKIAVQYEGPRDVDGMWSAKLYDRRSVKVGQARVMRTRPKFHHWTIEFTLAWSEDRITRENLVKVMREAGLLIGLGEFRSRFGKFEVSA